MRYNRSRLILVSCIVIASVLLSSFHSLMVATAQSGQDAWTAPINLSNSGGASSPSMVIDVNGVIHVLWQDEIFGTLYTRYQDQQWSEPVAVSLPFGVTTPFLIANPTGLIHAFWINELNQLNHSFVSPENFANGGSWFGIIQLAESAADFDVAFDNQGRMHVTYLRTMDTPDFPAGVYYRVSEDNGLNWTLASNIYTSPYYRSIAEDQANVDIEASSTEDAEVYLSWDNRSRKQVYYTRSLDGGATWEEPQIVASPSTDNPSVRPVNIRVEGYRQGLLRLWQDGDPAVSCRQYYQDSTDGGSTWGEPLEMLSGFSACPQEQYYFQNGDLLMLMTTLQSQVYLLAWNGNQWSFPQAQPDLISFQDPVTLDPVSLGCRRPGVDQSGDLTVVGCDTAGGGDIWVTDRSIGSVEEWFPPATSWTGPELVNQSEVIISSPILLADTAGRMHAFWIGQDTETETNSGRDSILYSRKDANTWTRPAAVLQSPTGFTRQPAAAIDGNDNLYVVWSGGQAGEIYFSRAPGNRANSPAEWVEAIVLPSVRQVGASPDIEIGPNGDIYVAYAIPLNEQRGVYVTKSEDGGTSWTEPVLAFDAVQAGWDLVDKPHILVSQNGVINVVMTKFSLPGGDGALGLFATISSDDGASWSEVKTVAEKQILWSDLLHTINGGVFRAWLESSIGGNFFQYQISRDQGVTWNPAASISTIGETVAEPALSSDVAGQIYLVQAIKDTTQGSLLRNWLWDGIQWQLGEDLQLADQNGFDLQAIAAAVSPQRRSAVVYASSFIDLLTNSPAYKLEYSDREVEIPAVLPTSQPEPTLQPAATPSLEIPVLPSPTPTVIVPTLPPVAPESESGGNIWMGLALGVVLGGVIAVVVFVVIIFKRKADK